MSEKTNCLYVMLCNKETAKKSILRKSYCYEIINDINIQF